MKTELQKTLMCYAVPGEYNIIDLVNPGTGKSEINGENLEQIRWDEVEEEKYQYAFECLPPAVMGGGAFMVGEPVRCPRFQGRQRKKRN